MILDWGRLIGKVAADHSHKWVFMEPQDNEANFLPAWQNPADSHPRTWEAQFQSGIKTIALIAVREGVIQLGAVTKVIEDLSYVLLLRKKFSYLESIPGVLLPHPLSSAAPLKLDGCGAPENWAASHTASAAPPPLPPMELLHLGHQGMFAPSASSLESLLSKLPSVGPSSFSPPPPPPGYFDTPHMALPPAVQRKMEVMGWEGMIIGKEETGDHEFGVNGGGMEQMAGSSTSGYYVHHARKTDQEGY